MKDTHTDENVKARLTFLLHISKDEQVETLVFHLTSIDAVNVVNFSQNEESQRKYKSICKLEKLYDTLMTNALIQDVIQTTIKKIINATAIEINRASLTWVESSFPGLFGFSGIATIYANAYKYAAMFKKLKKLIQEDEVLCYFIDVKY